MINIDLGYFNLQVIITLEKDVLSIRSLKKTEKD